jgi:hypothetical protein
MILIFEQDTRPHRGVSFEWKPEWFVSKFDKKTTWRFCWGVWSLSYFASRGLMDFVDHIKDQGTDWNSS